MTQRFVALPLLAFGLLAGAHAASTDITDEVPASFQRMLDHRAAEAAAPTYGGDRHDPLVAQLAGALAASGATPALSPAFARAVAAAPEDTLQASFDRMLGHTPDATPYPLPAATDNDPLQQHLASALDKPHRHAGAH